LSVRIEGGPRARTRVFSEPKKNLGRDRKRREMESRLQQARRKGDIAGDWQAILKAKARERLKRVTSQEDRVGSRVKPVG